MNHGSKLLLCILCLLISLQLTAQKKKSPPAKKPAAQTQPEKKPAEKTPAPKPKAAEQSDTENEKKVRDMVAFLEYLLNTLGSSATSTRDKEVVIRESYAKIFRDNKVQIEDDLESREVVTNKDVVAYLKDVDFFFKDVRFEFNIENIQGGGTENNKQFYKVTLQRNLKGTTLDGEQVNNTIPRYIEVNYDPEAEGLTIASIYTKGFDERAALTAWWNDLSLEWKSIFQKKLKLDVDTLSFDEVRRVASIDSLDLSNNLYIRTLEPLAQLSRLRYLNLSATTVDDLTAIRNLTELTDLSVSGTGVRDLTPLRYAASMRKLNAANTEVGSVEPLQKMPALRWLDISYTSVTDIVPIASLQELEHLSIAGTSVMDVTPLGKLLNLEHLNISKTVVLDLGPLAVAQKLAILSIDSTMIRDLRPLSSALALKELSANASRIDNLEPLKALPALERIYCDQTQIVRTVADAFMASRPTVLVIYDSKDLKAWWESLPDEWQKVFFSGTPGKDDLARLANLDSVNLTRYPAINTLEPLKKVPKLRTLIAAGTSISDLTPIKDHREVRTLDVSNTDISDVGPLRLWRNLVILKANSTKIQNIDPLTSLPELRNLYVDDTGINDLHAREFLSRKPEVLLVYKTYHVQRWWTKLPDVWRTVFQGVMKTNEPGKDDLHRLVEMKALVVNEAAIFDLSALSEFVQLEDFRFSGSSVTDLSPLTRFDGLKILHASASPLRDLEPLASMTSIEDLDVSSTPVSDLRDISGLINLKKFNCSGTEVRKLDPLKNMGNLEYLDCSNTSVRKLDPVEHLPLKTIKCFNSRVSKRAVAKLRERGIDVVFY